MSDPFLLITPLHFTATTLPMRLSFFAQMSIRVASSSPVPTLDLIEPSLFSTTSAPVIPLALPVPSTMSTIFKSFSITSFILTHCLLLLSSHGWSLFLRIIPSSPFANSSSKIFFASSRSATSNVFTTSKRPFVGSFLSLSSLSLPVASS